MAGCVEGGWCRFSTAPSELSVFDITTANTNPGQSGVESVHLSLNSLRQTNDTCCVADYAIDDSHGEQPGSRARETQAHLKAGRGAARAEWDDRQGRLRQLTGPHLFRELQRSLNVADGASWIRSTSLDEHGSPAP